MLEKVERLLADRRLPVAAVVVAVLLFLPALGAGLFADDLTHRASFSPELRLPGGVRGDWDIFRFQSADRENLRLMMDLGVWPWWTAPGIRLSFFRPLTSLSHALDYRVLGLPWLMHAESIALFAAITFSAAHLYRRLLAPTVGGLAGLLFAVDHTHAAPVGWIANRNALFAAVFGFAAVVLHDRARRDGHRLAAFVAPALYAAGLLGGEAAVATLAYLAAHALFVDEAPPRARVFALVPYALVSAAWAAVYKGLGHGCSGSGMYVDPATEPSAFAAAVALRLPALLLAQLTGPPADLWTQIPDRRLAAPLLAAVAVVVAVAVVMARVVGRDRRAAFFATGMLLSLVPVCGTMPNDRLLLFSSLGGLGLVALFLAHLRETAGDLRRRIHVPALTIAAALVLYHLVASPILLPMRVTSLAAFFRGYVARADESIPHGLGRDATLVVVNAPDLLAGTYVFSLRVTRHEPVAGRFRLLATAIGNNDIELARPDASTLVMTAREGLVDDAFSRVARGATVPFHAGDAVTIAGMTAEIEEVTSDARPRRVRFRFDRSLDDPSFRWITWVGQGFIPISPPLVGAKAGVAPIDWYAAVTAR
jgi:hypothetical protein